MVSGHRPLMLAIVVGLVIGKPFGKLCASALAVRLGVAVKPDAYPWHQVAGAGALAGIGFTISLFIAGEAFPAASDYAAAKIAVFAASVLCPVIGVAILWGAPAPASDDPDTSEAPQLPYKPPTRCATPLPPRSPSPAPSGADADSHGSMDHPRRELTDYGYAMVNHFPWQRPQGQAIRTF